MDREFVLKEMIMKNMIYLFVALFVVTTINARSCTDFDSNNKVIGHHEALVHCTAEAGVSGTVNSCHCGATFPSEACRKACATIARAPVDKE